MTGQQFLDELTKVIQTRNALLREYTPADLTRDASEVKLWFRQPSYYAEERGAAVEGARTEVETRPTVKTGGAE